MVRVGILGAAGYTGGELIRLLINHPQAEIVFANSESNACNLICDVHEGLMGETDMRFTAEMPFGEVDVVFFCFGHGKSRAFLQEHTIPSHVRIIDLAQDFRIAGEHDYVYGLPETHRQEISTCMHLANPGCFATCIQLGLLPALKAGIISGDIHTNGITGSIEAGTNLIGGQPVSLENMCAVADICHRYQIPSVLDASLLQDNIYFMKKREAQCKYMQPKEIYHLLADKMDIIYFSARKLGFARGGAILSHNIDVIKSMMEYIPLYEGFLTYGGIDVRSIEAMAEGLYESLDMEYLAHGPEFIAYLIKELDDYGVPVIKPAGGLGAHLNCSAFVPDMPHNQYPAGAVCAALYIAGGIRPMERGTLSEQREPDGTERYAELELARLAVPRRVFTLSQIKYVADRVKWLWDNRNLIGGLEWVEEPAVLRFFFGRLKEIGHWQEDLVAKFRADFGDSL